MAVHGQPAQQARMRLSVKRCEAPATHAGPASGLRAGELLEHLAAETAVVGVGQRAHVEPDEVLCHRAQRAMRRPGRAERIVRMRLVRDLRRCQTARAPT